MKKAYRNTHTHAHTQIYMKKILRRSKKNVSAAIFDVAIKSLMYILYTYTT